MLCIDCLELKPFKHILKTISDAEIGQSEILGRKSLAINDCLKIRTCGHYYTLCFHLLRICLVLQHLTQLSVFPFSLNGNAKG